MNNSNKPMILILSNNKYAEVLKNRLASAGYRIKLHNSSVSKILIQREKPDLIVCYDYTCKLDEKMINLLQGKLVIMHTSFFPFNKGAHPNLWSIINNTPQGVTIYSPTEDRWNGKILYQQELFFNEDKETLTSTHRKLHQAIVDLFIENVDNILSGKIELYAPLPGGSYHNLHDIDRFLDGKEIPYDMTIKEFKSFISGLDF